MKRSKNKGVGEIYIQKRENRQKTTLNNICGSEELMI